MNLHNLHRLGNRIPISIKPDEDGFTGRECPNPECEGYFKVQFGTGLKGENLPCHCPYCGHESGQNEFWTKEQIEYAKSIAHEQITDAIFKDLKSLEFESKPKGAFGIGISLKLQPGRPVPIRYYREKQLETILICNQCTLRYAIYGIFAFCPDCGVHNSKQILEKNLELAKKQLELSAKLDDGLIETLINDALENVVSAFDGFGRELCKVRYKSSNNPDEALKIRFQNLDGAKNKIIQIFGVDFSQGLSSDKWDFAIKEFQKRHLVSHKMGIVDQEYIDKSHDLDAKVGRKISIALEEVEQLITVISKLADYIVNMLP